MTSTILSRTTHKQPTKELKLKFFLQFTQIFSILSLFLDISLLYSRLIICYFPYVPWSMTWAIESWGQVQLKSVQRSIIMTNEFHTEHKQISFDQQTQGFHAKTFKKERHIYIWYGNTAMLLWALLWPCYINMSWTHVKGMWHFLLWKTARPWCSQTNTELQIIDLCNISDNIQTS